MIERERQKPIAGLVRELLDDAGELVREEVRLARAETHEKLSELGRNLVPIGVGAVLGLSAMLMLVAALEHGLTALLAAFLPPGVAVWLAPLILAMALGVAAWSFINKGKTAIQRLSLVPERTRQTLQEDRAWIRSRLS
jgi:hypothetical protein